jgi:hypothetical protein
MVVRERLPESDYGGSMFGVTGPLFYAEIRCQDRGWQYRICLSATDDVMVKPSIHYPRRKDVVKAAYLALKAVTQIESVLASDTSWQSLP